MLTNLSSWIHHLFKCLIFTFHNIILIRRIKSCSLVDNCILRTEFTKRCFVLSTYIISCHLYFLIKLILKFIHLMFKNFTSLVFIYKQIDIIISCVIIYKNNIVLFFHLYFSQTLSYQCLNELNLEVNTSFNYFKIRFCEFLLYINITLMLFLKNHTW